MADRQPTVISGVVRDDKGRPVPNARIYFTDGPGSLADIAALTDAGGHFSLSAPLPGAYALAVAADGFQTATARATVRPAGKPSRVEVKLKGGN